MDSSRLQIIAERDNDSLRTDLKSKMVEMDRLKLTVESTRRTIEEVRRENDALRVEIVEKEQILIERNSLAKRLEIIEHEKNQLDSQLQKNKLFLQKTKEKVEKNEELQADLLKCEEEKESFTKRVEEMTRIEERLQREMEIVKNESKRVSQEKTVEIAQLRDLVEEQRTSYDVKKGSIEDALRKERILNERYKHDLIDCGERISSLESSLTGASLELAQSNDQTEQFEKEYEQSKKRMDEVEREIAQYKIELGRERQKTHSLNIQMTRTQS
jgi:chromosome segregation ATPase